MAKITSVKVLSDNGKLFTSEINNDNTRDFNEYDISTGINNKSLTTTTDVTSFDDGMNGISINPTGDNIIGLDNRGRDVINLNSDVNFTFENLSVIDRLRVTRLIRGNIFNQSPAGVDTDFTTLFDGRVFSIEPTNNGGYIVTGLFTNYDTTYSKYIAILNSDGSLNPISPQLNTNNQPIRHAIQLTNGKYILVGDFTTVNFQTKNKIMRLNSDGTIDNTFTGLPSITGDILKVREMVNGDLLIMGSFTIGSFNRHISILNPDGTLKTSVRVWTNGVVRDGIVEASTATFVGDFTSVGWRSSNTQIRNRIAQIDNFNSSTFPNGFNPSVDDRIFSIKKTNDARYLISGQFSNIGGHNTSKIGFINTNGSVDTNFSSQGVGNSVQVVNDSELLDNGKVLIGGSFATINGITQQRIAVLNSNGTLDTNFTFNAGGEVYVVKKINGSYYFGSMLDYWDGITPYGYMIKYDFGDAVYVEQEDIIYENMSTDSVRLFKLKTTSTTPFTDINAVTISNGVNSVVIGPAQVNQEININTITGTNIILTFDITGVKPLQTILDEYSFAINK